MSADLSQSWLAQAGRSSSRDGLFILGLLAIAAGAVTIALTFLIPPATVPAILFIGRALTALGGFFVAVPLFLGAAGEDRWSNGLRIAALVVGFLFVLFLLVRI